MGRSQYHLIMIGFLVFMANVNISWSQFGLTQPPINQPLNQPFSPLTQPGLTTDPDDMTADSPSGQPLLNQPLSPLTQPELTNDPDDMTADSPAGEPLIDQPFSPFNNQPLLNQPLSPFNNQPLLNQPLSPFSSQPLINSPFSTINNQPLTNQPLSNNFNQPGGLNQPGLSTLNQPFVGSFSSTGVTKQLPASSMVMVGGLIVLVLQALVIF